MAILDPNMLTNGFVQALFDHLGLNLGILTISGKKYLEFGQYSLFLGTFMAFHTSLLRMTAVLIQGFNQLQSLNCNQILP